MSASTIDRVKMISGIPVFKNANRDAPHRNIVFSFEGAHVLRVRDQKSSVWVQAFYNWVRQGYNRHLINGLDIASVATVLCSTETEYNFISRKIREELYMNGIPNRKDVPVCIMHKNFMPRDFPHLSPKRERQCRYRLYTMPWDDTIRWAKAHSGETVGDVSNIKADEGKGQKPKTGKTRILLSSTDTVTVNLKDGEIVIDHGEGTK